MSARGLFARVGAVLAAVLAAGVVAAVPAGAVADGVTATTGQFPYAVQLRFDDIKRADGTTYDSACSGVLVSRTWIMTAGHCFHDGGHHRMSGTPRYASTARLGTVNTTDPQAGVTRTVTWVKQSSLNDIALARLSAPVDGIAPPRLNTAAPAVGRVLAFAGWGGTTATGPWSDQLNWGRVRVNAVKATTVLVTGYQPLPTTSACAHDSGAPYLATSTTGVVVLVGIESTGPTCPHKLPETTARVDVVLGWARGIVTDLPR